MKTRALEKLQGITEVSLYVKDLKRSEQFYQNVLGLELINTSDRFRFFRLGQQVLLLFLPDKSKELTELPPHFAEGNQHIAFMASTEAYESWKTVLKENNVEILTEQTWSNTGFRSFYFLDPDNHVLEILEGNIWV